MTAITNDKYRSLIFKEASQGAAIGAQVGTVLVCGTVSMGLFHQLLEAGNRAIGNEPKWPFFEGDCQMPQLRNIPMCTQEPYSFLSFTACVIGASTVCGMVVGAVSGVAKVAFEKSDYRINCKGG